MFLSAHKSAYMVYHQVIALNVGQDKAIKAMQFLAMPYALP